ncbi:(2Fe-2S)-binding protein [Bacillus sp. ISL-4]|uniref:(2Fe-2S)-binding protein n=1 Tax=Bacillus sp. ISL-4 TaxID=2819125 RepID=UPI001BE86557|nr:(2Fe-2S)-binding protein [Bacillus sp. ISL-4]MBT2669018.1 (2Fe-2S)-binding protein [Bacillus sp. ISL-4]MBT2671363.1 (2Fe-2S)-binding protein [Streptomyces sp. ISL-14]
MTLEKIELTVNGKKVIKEVESRLLLADFLREELRLTGTHLGCEHGVCGACTVKMDNRPVRSCLVFAVQADKAEIETVESLMAKDGKLHPLQQAFSDNHALQCGFCTPGFLMSLVCDLDKNPSQDENEIREMISGNLCRCTGYTNIIKAVKQYTTEKVLEQNDEGQKKIAVKS